MRDITHRHAGVEAPRSDVSCGLANCFVPPSSQVHSMSIRDMERGTRSHTDPQSPRSVRGSALGPARSLLRASLSCFRRVLPDALYQGKQVVDIDPLIKLVGSRLSV